MKTAIAHVRRTQLYGAAVTSREIFNSQKIHTIWRTKLEVGNTGYVYKTYISEADEKVIHRW